MEANRRNIKDAGDPYFAPLTAGAQAAYLYGVERNQVFAAGQSGNVTGAVPIGQTMYALKFVSVGSGFFQVSFNGTMTPSVAGTSTLSVGTQIATVPGAASTIGGNTVVGTSVGTGTSAHISAAAGGITTTFAGGIAAVVVHVTQVQISAAGDLDIPYEFNLVVGASAASPAARVALGSGVIIELLVSATAGTLTPLALSNAFGGYELP